MSTVHLWAYPVTDTGYGAPHFLGEAQYGGARPDVKAHFGQRFARSAFTMVINNLLPGTYDLAVFPYSAVAGKFAGARVVRVTVR